MEALNALRLRARVTTNITVALEADPAFDASKHLEAETSDIWKWFQGEMRSSG